MCLVRVHLQTQAVIEKWLPWGSLSGWGGVPELRITLKEWMLEIPARWVARR